MLEICLAAVVPKRSRPKADEAAALVERYCTRAARYTPVEALFFESEEALLSWGAKQPGKAAAVMVLCDPRGKLLTSDEFAGMLGRRRDEGTQRLVVGIGPADGWSERARLGAGALVSFGRITLPHELARVVAAEQVYRAMTILSGHPYHCGHLG